MRIPENINQLLGKKEESTTPTATVPFVVNIISNSPEVIRVINQANEFADEVVLQWNGELVELGDYQMTPFGLPFSGKLIRFAIGPWQNNFAKARNQCLEHTPDGSWVLWLDTDDELSDKTISHLKWLKAEILSKGLTKTIYEIKVTNRGTHDQFFQKRIFPYKKRVWNPHDEDPIPGIEWYGSIHEQLSGADLLFETSRLEGPEILHTGYETPELRAMKAKRNAELLLAIPMGERQDRDLTQLGDCYASIEEYDRALFWYLECESGNPLLWFKVGICYEHLGKFWKAKEYYLASGTKEGVGKVVIMEYLAAKNQLEKRLAEDVEPLVGKYMNCELPRLENYSGIVEEQMGKIGSFCTELGNTPRMSCGNPAKPWDY